MRKAFTLSLRALQPYSLRRELHAICARMKWIIDNNTHFVVQAHPNALIFRDVTVMRHRATNGGNRQLTREILHAYYVGFMMHLMQM